MGEHARLVLLAALCILLFFLELGSLGLTDRDEGSNAQAAREMVLSGDWVTPTLNGSPRFAKPAFLYWMISGAYRVFGISEFTARVPSALFGCGLVLMQYFFTRRFLGSTTGFRAALMLLLNFEILAIGRMVLTDMVLVFFTTLSIFCFFTAMWGAGNSKRWYWGFYLGMAFGVLTKGPVGLLVPLLAIGSYLLLTRPWKTGHSVLQECHPLAGTFLLIAIAAPWYGAMFVLHGGGYGQSVKGDTVTRFFSAIGGHGGTIFFYLPVLFLGFFPWSGFLPSALYDALRGIRDRPAEEPRRALIVLSALWIIAVIIFFTLSSTRLPHYIAPLFPAASLLVAAYWDTLLADQESRASKVAVGLTMLVGGCLGFAFIGLDWAYERFNAQIALEFPIATQIGPGWAPMAIGFLTLAGLGFFAYAAMENRSALSFGILSALMLGVVLLIITVALPRFNRYFIAPPQELAAIAGLNLSPQETLITYGRPKPSLLFYAKRDCSAAARCIEVIKTGEETELLPLLQRPGQIIILTQERLREKLPLPAANYPIVLSRYGYILLAKNPVF